MTSDELDRALRQLRLGGMAKAVSLRAQQARAEKLGPVDFLSLLVHDELEKRRDRLLDRRIKAAEFRDIRTLDTFDWKFNSLDRALDRNSLADDSLNSVRTFCCSETPASARATSRRRSAWLPLWPVSACFIEKRTYF